MNANTVVRKLVQGMARDGTWEGVGREKGTIV